MESSFATPCSVAASAAWAAGSEGFDRFRFCAREVVADGVGNDEVAVGEALHERAGAEAIGAVVGEVGFAENEQAGDGALQLVVDPEAAHGVVDGGVDAHRDLVGIFVGDALIHVEEVAVALADGLGAEAADGVGEVEVDAEAGFADAAAFVADGFGVAGGDVAGDEVAEGGIFALEVVVALVFGDLIGLALVTFLLWDPDAAVVAERLGHERELGLVVAGDGDAGGVNLREAGIGEERAAFVRAPDGGGVRAFGVGGEVVDVAVAASGEDDGVGEMHAELAGDEIAGDDAAGLAVDDDEVEHLGARDHGDLAGVDLALEGLIGAEQKLLAGLAARVEGARNLGAAEGAVVEGAAVFAGEGDALGDALVDDVDAVLREAVDVAFASAEVAAFDGVVEEAVDAVAVVLIILGGVDAALRGDGVRAAGRILKAEALDVVAEFAAGWRRRSRRPVRSRRR